MYSYFFIWYCKAKKNKQILQYVILFLQINLERKPEAGRWKLLKSEIETRSLKPELFNIENFKRCTLNKKNLRKIRRF